MKKSDSFQSLLELGEVEKGDLLLVHSAYSKVKNQFSNPNELLQILIDFIGPEGTLLIPAFNFTSWSNGHYFDILETPSEMGVLTEVARARKDFKRTKHPIYSFLVFGKLQKEFLECNDKEAFGDQSVFSLFHHMNGNIMSIGLPFNNSFTLVHYVELQAGVNYRRIKDFSGIYVGENRQPELKTYSMLVRATLKTNTMVTPALEIIQDKGIIKVVDFRGAKIDFSRAAPFYEHLFPLVKSNPELFHQIN